MLSKKEREKLFSTQQILRTILPAIPLNKCIPWSKCEMGDMNLRFPTFGLGPDISLTVWVCILKRQYSLQNKTTLEVKSLPSSQRTHTLSRKAERRCWRNKKMAKFFDKHLRAQNSAMVYLSHSNLGMKLELWSALPKSNRFNGPYLLLAWEGFPVSMECLFYTRNRNLQVRKIPGFFGSYLTAHQI